jgi:hypothetical protein
MPMISNPERTLIFSSIGWVDRDALWRFDGTAASEERLPLGSGARYLSLHSSGSSYFSVGYHFDGARFDLTLHRFSDPLNVVARATVSDEGRQIVGDSSAWKEVPLLYVEYLGFEPWKDFVLLRISPSTTQIEVQRLEWYGDTYDKGYQGVIDVLAVPGEELAFVSVQRSSEVILHDLETGGKRGSIDLGGRGGNPRLRFRNGSNEIWASDYDTLVVLDGKERRVVRRARLQRAAAGTQQFIGDYSFAPEGQICVVARPFSGDVIGIDVATLKVKSSARLGRQALDVMALPRGEVVARDWNTGDFLRGRLERRWLAW